MATCPIGLVIGTPPHCPDCRRCARDPRRRGKCRGRWLLHTQHDAKGALAIAEQGVAAIRTAGLPTSISLLRLAAEAAGRIGQVDEQEAFLKEGLTRDAEEPGHQAMLWADWADRLFSRGHIVEAENWLAKSLAFFTDLGDVRSIAITQGQIADILPARRARRGPAHPPGRTAAGLRTARRRPLAPPSPGAGSPTSCQRARRLRRGPAHPPRGASCRSTNGSATSASRRHPGQDRRHPATAGRLDEALRIRREEAAAGLRTARRHPRVAPSPGQDRRHPGPARASSTRPCASAGGAASGLRTARRHPLASPSPGQDRRHPAQRGRVRRGPAHPPEEELPVYERLGDVRSTPSPGQDRRHPDGAASSTRPCASARRSNCRSSTARRRPRASP